MIAAWQLAIAIVVIWYVVFEWWMPAETVVSIASSEALYARTRGFLEPEHLQSLTDLVSSHDATTSLLRDLHRKQRVPGSTPPATNLLLRMNRAGFKTYCKSPAVASLCHFISRVNLHEANAFLVKVHV
eukprot:CAMPEP_0173442518 /NCGR_PEP_ID=MMETSP1357-20121228/27218_1 /TAXON_ID=77926 /ORGANISM="Hemiselmis rufescens, Strain PCC563" /LENGTH=128 /DNA_ID=CAMNT_0014408285 /DNA_START=57 /DNA_END=439 /DNA_ORIENTATION=-